VNIYLYEGASNLGAIATGVPIGNAADSWRSEYIKKGTEGAMESIYRFPGDPGFFSWTVGALGNGTSVPAGTRYSVRVTTSDGIIFGTSAGTFMIKE